MPLRELDERQGGTAWLAERLDDPRNGTRTLHSLVRTRLHFFALGWRDADDVERHREDPACLLAVSDRAGDMPLRKEQLALTATLHRTSAILAQDDNLLVAQEALVNGGRSAGMSRRRAT